MACLLVTLSVDKDLKELEISQQLLFLHVNVPYNQQKTSFPFISKSFPLFLFQLLLLYLLFITLGLRTRMLDDSEAGW